MFLMTAIKIFLEKQVVFEKTADPVKVLKLRVRETLLQPFSKAAEDVAKKTVEKGKDPVKAAKESKFKDLIFVESDFVKLLKL